jgi:hypothetical protein
LGCVPFTPGMTSDRNFGMDVGRPLMNWESGAGKRVRI